MQHEVQVGRFDLSTQASQLDLHQPNHWECSCFSSQHYLKENRCWQRRLLRLKAPARALWLTLRTRTRPGSSAPSKQPFVQTKQSHQRSHSQWPLMLHNFSVPFPTISCNHKMQQFKCLTSNSPSIQDSFGTNAISVDVDMSSFVGDPCQQPGK